MNACITLLMKLFHFDNYPTAVKCIAYYDVENPLDSLIIQASGDWMVGSGVPTAVAWIGILESPAS